MRTKPSLVYFSNVCDRRNTKRMKTLHILQQVALMSKQDFLIGMFFRLYHPPIPQSLLLQRNYIDLCLPFLLQFSNPWSLENVDISWITIYIGYLLYGTVISMHIIYLDIWATHFDAKHTRATYGFIQSYYFTSFCGFIVWF